MKKNLFISFSGGETSAFMTIWILANIRNLYNEIVIVFANTGQENEETLLFVKLCAEYFGFKVVWVEAVVNPEANKGTKHRVVDFETASRNGEPFEDVIKKYGIPNPDWLHCTRELKTAPMYSYIRSIGWKKADFHVAIGIRIDEIGRADDKADKKGIIYPLITMVPVIKSHINGWWKEQPFRLNLKGYQGNCKWCWKKGMRKHLTILNENPEFFDFPERMEELYGMNGVIHNEEPRVFFRDKINTKQLREFAKVGHFTPADDDSRVYPEPDMFGYKLDINSGCAESCEVLFGDFEDEVIE